MYLKSIEIQGFKSFANKILLEFHDGITGIVGPNGSGKSNVADAVRWVLGEQSAKQLRGSKMEDIIFSGTETRKPLGFAYVAITLDNKDHNLPIEYEQVTVARRVYRSGESEYLINGNSCRLRDVQELFLDTGIGKEGYSIIGQGQIDKILSGKPEDRRELFDEAVGIVKYKKRKALAQKNLEEEKQNLCRINDILSEIEKQVTPLEEQSVIAKDYLRLKEELKIYDVNMFLLEYERIHNQNIEITNKLEVVNEDLANTQKQYASTKEEYERLEIQIEDYNSKLEDGKTKLNEAQLRKEKLEGSIEVSKERIQAMLQSEEHYKERSSTLHNEKQAREKEHKEYEVEKSHIESSLSELIEKQLEDSNKLKEVVGKIETGVREVEQYKKDILDYMNQDIQVKTSLERYETILEQTNLKKISLNQQLLQNKSEEDLLEKKMIEEKSELDRLDDIIGSIKNDNLNIEEKIGRLNQVIQEFNKILDEKQLDYHKSKSRLESLKDITERYEGYGNSIRKVMEQKEYKSGVIGVVADIIQVDKTFETAIETALGGSIQNIVTEDELVAKELIEFLKKNKYGRATFLPLTSIKNNKSFQNPSILKENGVVGLADSLVSTDNKFRNLIGYLLGRTVVVDNINNGIALAKKYNYTLRIVTKEGEQLNPGGSMSGGAYRNTNNLISRRREIDDLKEHIGKLLKSMKLLELDIGNEKEEKSKQKQNLDKNLKKIQELYILQNTSRVNLSQYQNKKIDIAMNYEMIQRDSKEMDSSLIELRGNIENTKEQLLKTADKHQEKERNIQDMNELLDKTRDKKRLLNETLSSIMLETSSLEQKKQYSIENMLRVQKEIQKIDEEYQALTMNKEQSLELIKAKENEILSTKEEVSNLGHTILELNDMIVKIQQERDSISKNHKSFFSKREELSERENILDKEAFRLGNQFEKLTEQLDNLVSYMWEEYELTYGNSIHLRNEELSSSNQMKKNIQQLKSQIKALGSVNVNAIEDYKNLIERFELLSTQRDDLVESEEALNLIIAELDNEMRKQFEERFYEIKKQFDQVFKELFGGGKGTLELIEGEDILESGIRIIAQPPGKKLQNMMQLSGGEKALTAISLLFAIQNLKPSPFCLLDEIEAALDDSNVKRYAKYLHKLTKETQFIIITHRRGTMAAADALYGITMQEKGVSTLVSVNLIENQLDK